MDVKLRTYFSELEKANRSSDVWELFLKYLESHGFKTAVYTYTLVPTRGVGDLTEGTHGLPEASLDHLTFLSNVHPDLIEAYIKEDFFKHDYITEHGKTSFNPILVGAEFVPEDNNPDFEKQREMLTMAEPYGVRFGIAVPIFNASKRGNGSVVIHCDKTREEFFEVLEISGARLQTACLYFHQYFQIHNRRERAERTGITARQFEVMEFIVSGLQNREIAERMGVKEATVSLHITELKKRLEVATAREIIRAALGLGLVDL